MSEHETMTPSTNISFVDPDGKQYGIPRDASGNPVMGIADLAVQVAGGTAYLPVVDIANNLILSDLLKELKKINLHLSMMTDNTFKNTEVE